MSGYYLCCCAYTWRSCTAIICAIALTHGHAQTLSVLRCCAYTWWSCTNTFCAVALKHGDHARLLSVLLHLHTAVIHGYYLCCCAYTWRSRTATFCIVAFTHGGHARLILALAQQPNSHKYMREYHFRRRALASTANTPKCPVFLCVFVCGECYYFGLLVLF